MSFQKRQGALTSLESSPEVFDGALDSFRRWMDANLRATKTMQGYLLATRHFHHFLVTHALPTQLKQIRQQQIEMWLVSLRSSPSASGQPLRISSINNYQGGLKAFFTWCVEEELVDRSPMARIRKGREDKTPPEILREEDVKKLLKACEGKGFTARRDMALMRLWLATGIRRAEITGIRVTDVDLDHRVIRVTGKNRESRDVRIGRKAVVALDRYLQVRRKHRCAEEPQLWLGNFGPLGYPGIYCALRRRAATAGIAHVHPHMWRHLMAHRYLHAGGGEVNLKSLMGWKSDAMLSRYGASMIASRARDEYDRLGLDDEL